MTVFNPNLPTYRACCFHIRTCTIAVGIIEIFLLIGDFIQVTLAYTTGHVTSPDHIWVPSTAHFVATCSGVFIGLVVITLLFVGIYKEHDGLLLPHLIYQIIGIIGMVVAIVLFSIASVELRRADPDRTLPPTADIDATPAPQLQKAAVFTAMAVGFGLSIILQILFLIIVYKCYSFLRDKRQHTPKTVSAYKA